MTHAHRHACRGADFAQPGAERHYAPDLALEPTKLEVALRFDLAAKRAEGSVLTTFVARRAERSLALDAVDLHDLQVSDPAGRELSWSYDGGKVRACWAEAPAVGEERQLRVDYRVERPLTGMDFSWPDEAYPDRPRFVATDHETERARYWLPCVDHPSVRTPLELRLRADAQYTILANGLLVSEEAHDDGTKTVHWRLDYPCPSYLICLAIGELMRVDGGRHQDVEIAFFAPTSYAPEDLSRSFGHTQAMLDWMTEKLAAPFPFPKYYQVALPGIGGAMENISLVTWDDRFILDPVLEQEWARLLELINVHEMAHSYFGDAIVIRDFAHAWLKESWATYVEALWVEDTHGEEELHYHLHEESQRYCKEADERYARPIVTRTFDSSWDMYDMHLYPGGAWRLHMLRRMLGDEAFFAGVRAYVARYSGKVVESDDLRRCLEEHSGLSLARFFDEWLASPGYPKLKVSFEHDAERGEAKLGIEQTQVDAKQGIGVFHLELEVACELPDGQWHTSRLSLQEAKHSLVIPLAERPRQVVIDPEMKVLCGVEFAPGHDLLVRSLSAGPLRGRLHAAHTLGKSGKARATQAIEDAWGEAFWGVRVAAAEALGEAGSQPAAEALARLLERERDPRVLAPLASACGAYRDAGIAAALAAFLARELPYHARAAALLALGKQRGEAHLERLEQAAEDASWGGWVRAGALKGLGATRTARGCELLRERLAYGRDTTRVRSVAARVLGGAARFLERGPRQAALEALADGVRDPEYGMREAVGSGLGSLGETGGVPALEALAQGLAAQDRPWLQRTIAGLRKRAGAGGDVSKLTKRVEELEAKLRKLAGRLEQVESRQRPPE